MFAKCPLESINPIVILRRLSWKFQINEMSSFGLKL